MTRAQEHALEDLALEHGRVAVHEGYADRGVRVWAQGATHLIIREGGEVAQQPASSRSDIDWSYAS